MRNVKGCVGIVEDITEHKKLQAQLLQARKMESIGMLAGGIAHDFNNLLHAMGGNLELLDRKIPEDHPGKKRISTIQKSINRAAQLVRQMLQFSRKAEAKRQDMDLNQEIQHAAEMLERTIPKMISIELSLDKEARFINADPIQVEQILLNLGMASAYGIVKAHDGYITCQSQPGKGTTFKI